MQKLLQEMHRWMNGYMRSFRTDDPDVMRGIRLKEIHTGYVTANARVLAKHLGSFTMSGGFASTLSIRHSTMHSQRITPNLG